LISAFFSRSASFLNNCSPYSDYHRHAVHIQLYNILLSSFARSGLYLLAFVFVSGNDHWVCCMAAAKFSKLPTIFISFLLLIIVSNLENFIK